MAEIFISYARENIAFVRKLHAALTTAGRDAWVDWEGIPPVDKWLDKIRSAIDESDAFLFIISPDSLASDVCAVELGHAVKQHKRLIPVLYQEATQNSLPAVLAEINWIFARENDDLAAAVETIQAAMDTDLDWVRQHSRLLVRAGEWADANGGTLRGIELKEYEAWLQQSAEKKPGATELQTRFLLESRRAETRRKGVFLASLVIGLSLLLVVGLFGWFQHRESLRQSLIAESRALLNQADSLRDAPVDEENPGAHFADSTRAAVKALAMQRALGLPATDADRAVRKSFGMMPKWRDTDFGASPIKASEITRSGSAVAVYLADGRLLVWHGGTGKQSACDLPSGKREEMMALAIKPDGSAVAVLFNARAAAVSRIGLIAIRDCSELFGIELDEAIEYPALATSGRYLAVKGAGALHVWDTQTGAEVTPGTGEILRSFDLSPDGTLLATLERNRGERQLWVRIREIATGELAGSFNTGRFGRRLEWTDAGLLLAGGKEARLLDPRTGKQLAGATAGELHAIDLEAGRAASATGDRIVITRLAGGETLDMVSFGKPLHGLALQSGSPSVVAVTGEHLVRQWWFDLHAEFASRSEPAASGRVAFDDAGMLHVEKTNGEAVAWRLPDGLETRLERVDEAQAGAPFTGTSRQLQQEQQGDFRKITLVDAGGGNPQNIEHQLPIMAAALGNDGTRIALLLSSGSTRGGYRRLLEVRNLATGESVRRDYQPIPGRSPYLEFIGEGRGYIAIDRREGVEILDAATLETSYMLYQQKVVQTAIDASGTFLAALDDNGEVRVWNITLNSEAAHLKTATAIRAMGIDRNGRWLATLGRDGMIRIHALKHEDLIRQVCDWLKPPCPDIGGIAFP
ncbi:MAG: TIR domain-containing protein [Gammaproteobacteria bacterium]|jgi:WD40 repeat protein